MNRRLRGLACWLLLSLAGSCAFAQGEQNSDGETNASAQANPDASTTDTSGDDMPLTQDQDSPSLSVLPSERPSFVIFGFLAGEGVQTNGNGSLNGDQSIGSTPRFEGDVDLLKYWRRSVSAFDYIGGGVFYGSGAQQIQQFTGAHRIDLGKRKLTFSDSFGHSYGANFGSSAFGGGGLNNLLSGSNASNGVVSPGSSLFTGGTNFSAVGSGPYLTNVARAVLSESVSRRSSFTVSGSYGFTTYNGSNVSLIDSRQFSVTASYERMLSVKSAVGVSYGYRDLTYPHNSTGSVFDQVAYLSYLREISSRTRISVGVGPEFTSFSTRIQIPFATPLYVVTGTHQINASAFASVLHNLRKASLDLSYERLISSGSGVVAGANSDVVHASAGRSVFKYWGVNLDGGYSRLTQIGPPTQGAGLAYEYWYAGGAVRRLFLNGFGVFASYQYNRDSSNNLVCLLTRACGYGSNVAVAGVSWQARPIRLDHGSNMNQTPHATGAGDEDPSSDQPAIDQGEKQTDRN